MALTTIFNKCLPVRASAAKLVPLGPIVLYTVGSGFAQGGERYGQYLYQLFKPG